MTVEEGRYVEPLYRWADIYGPSSPDHDIDDVGPLDVALGLVLLAVAVHVATAATRAVWRLVHPGTR